MSQRHPATREVFKEQLDLQPFEAVGLAPSGWGRKASCRGRSRHADSPHFVRRPHRPRNQMNRPSAARADDVLSSEAKQRRGSRMATGEMTTKDTATSDVAGIPRGEGQRRVHGQSP